MKIRVTDLRGEWCYCQNQNVFQVMFPYHSDQMSQGSLFVFKNQ